MASGCGFVLSSFYSINRFLNLKLSEANTFLNNFKHYSSWINILNDMNENLWTKSISKGKWSVSEIIAHIIN